MRLAAVEAAGGIQIERAVPDLHKLIKTEPETWSWADQEAAGVTNWDGVRNYQAAGNMKKMVLGDFCFFAARTDNNSHCKG